MGRPLKLTIDFFLHDANASDNLKLRRLERKHGNDGYATYFKLLEKLCNEEGMLLKVSDTDLAELLAEDFNLRDAHHFLAIIEDCVKYELFDRQLWQSERIVFSHGLHHRYQSRLEERKEAAERMKRKREAARLTDKLQAFRDCSPEQPRTISEHTPNPSDQNSEYKTRTQNTNTDPERKKEGVAVSRSQLPKAEEDFSSEPFSPEVPETEIPQAPDPELTGQVIQDPVQPERSSRGKGTAKTKNGECSAAGWEDFREKYNAHKPPIWPELQVVNPARQKKIKQLIADCGGRENALQALGNALDYAKDDPWYSTKTLSFENFASNDKILQLHERQTGRLTQGVPIVTESVQKHLNTRLTVSQALAQFRQEVGSHGY